MEGSGCLLAAGWGLCRGLGGVGCLLGAGGWEGAMCRGCGGGGLPPRGRAGACAESTTPKTPSLSSSRLLVSGGSGGPGQDPTIALLTPRKKRLFLDTEAVPRAESRARSCLWAPALASTACAPAVTPLRKRRRTRAQARPQHSGRAALAGPFYSSKLAFLSCACLPRSS